MDITNNKVNNSKGNRMIMSETKNLKINERIFLLCDQCFWTVTCLDKTYLKKILVKNRCPRCNQDQYLVFQECQMMHLLTVIQKRGVLR